MNYHNIHKCDTLNGDGIRVTLFVSGCSHHCKGCQNSQTWNEHSGIPFDQEAYNEIRHELEQDWCSGLTLSGGDPLYLSNRKSVYKLVYELKREFPNKTIWLYTGYTLKELMTLAETEQVVADILSYIDVLVDGKFEQDKLSPNKHWVGSSNQNVIRFKKKINIFNQNY